MKFFLKCTSEGILAGAMIVIGCAVYLACDVKWVGAVLFSVALITICIMGFSLYTGRIAFVLDAHKKDDVAMLLCGLLGNVTGAALFGYLLGAALPDLCRSANALALSKLDVPFLQTLIRGTFCGVLMCVAVTVYKERNSVAGIVFCIPVFIIAGFEHSIADMGYFAIGRVFSLEAFDKSVVFSVFYAHNVFLIKWNICSV